MRLGCAHSQVSGLAKMAARRQCIHRTLNSESLYPGMRDMTNLSGNGLAFFP